MIDVLSRNGNNCSIKPEMVVFAKTDGTLYRAANAQAKPHKY